ncbi:MAG: hypothetical protein ACP5OG_05680 [Candidatus Nanoarchaeia archaeon]
MKLFYICLALIVVLGIFSVQGVLADVTGANYTNISEGRAAADNASARTAFAGNVSEISITSNGVTSSWQGFYGNVSGVIQLADSNSKVMYNWSSASPDGEIFASTNGTGIQWSNVQCFNFTANATFSYAESGTGGTTNIAGLNLTGLETRFGINTTDADGVDQTFNLWGTGHDAFSVSTASFDSGECRNTRIFDNTGLGVDGNFEEVLLYEPVSHSVVFAALLNQDVLGFDGRHHDFEMLVLENGHLGDTSTTLYYFYTELQ